MITKHFKDNPIEEPEIMKVAEECLFDPIDMQLKMIDIIEDRTGEEVKSLEDVGKVINHVLGHKYEDGTFKKTKKTENIEPLKPRDTLKLMKMAKEDADEDEMFNFIKERTNVPDDLTQWEKTLVLKEALTYGSDAFKTSIGAALGN